jgi:hypothetical protein
MFKTMKEINQCKPKLPVFGEPAKVRKTFSK